MYTEDNLPKQFPIQQNLGWQCPKCGSVYAPFVGSCGKCNAKTALEKYITK